MENVWTGEKGESVFFCLQQVSQTIKFRDVSQAVSLELLNETWVRKQEQSLNLQTRFWRTDESTVTASTSVLYQPGRLS